jgi:hypothetical protein
MAGMATGWDPGPVDQSDDLPPRRPLFFPVVIATVFLTIIGMSAGLVLGARAEQSAREPTPPTQQPVTQQPESGGPPCPPQSQVQGRLADAGGVLRVVLQVRTASSTVWICAGPDRRLYYHGNRGGENAEWIEGETALFLTGVVAFGDGYRAAATDAEGRATVFEVTRQRLAIRHVDGRTEVQQVRTVVAG